MKFIFVYIIIYLSHIECINSENKRTSSQFISNFISPQYYKKIIDKYDTNLQIIENKTIIREILINTSYLSNFYNF